MTGKKVGWLTKLKDGLSSSANKISNGISAIFTKRRLDQESLDQLEELLISSDISYRTTQKLIKQLAQDRFDKDVTANEVKELLADYISRILSDVEKELIIDDETKPQVILICGVNGNGKTTTVGKLAAGFKEDGNHVILAACDTFRAAASLQLETWAKRTDCQMISGNEGSDPASVAYSALALAKEKNADILLIDTAGRLHNKTGLMEELAKIIRVLKKIDENAPHNILLVLDATTGQNAYNQVETFTNMVNLTGLIVTKLDGTAKGGMVVSLAEQFKLPIHAIGVGERVEDLQAFDAKEFAKNLLGIDD